MTYLGRFLVDLILFAVNSQKFHHDISISLKISENFQSKTIKAVFAILIELRLLLANMLYGVNNGLKSLLNLDSHYFN